MRDLSPDVDLPNRDYPGFLNRQSEQSLNIEHWTPDIIKPTGLPGAASKLVG